VPVGRLPVTFCAGVEQLPDVAPDAGERLAAGRPMPGSQQAFEVKGGFRLQR
jgi:hypothetical protein